MSDTQKIIYTITDEAPALATASFLPIVQSFAKKANIAIETMDISLAGRILANFPDYLTDEQKRTDDLALLGDIVKQPSANVIKLPNISASVPQLIAAIEELQAKGFKVPDFPETPENEEEKSLKKRYGKVLGSAVNPVLREGNSDRRPPLPVKEYTKSNPPARVAWSPTSKTHVAHMTEGDFFSNETSVVINGATEARIIFTDKSGAETVLKDNIALQDKEVLDATFMSVKSLRAFIKAQIEDAKEQGVLFSVHLKATMMKVSDPVIFGHVVSVYLDDVFEKYADLFKELGINPNNGSADIVEKIAALSIEQQDEIETAIADIIALKADLMMVDAQKGLTNLNRPNDVIIDASIPPIIRWGGQTTGADGAEHDVKIVVPDQTYAVFHKAMADFAKEHGGFDPATMGSVYNIGLMAQKAEEYGSHDKTFMAPADGTIKIVDGQENILHSHAVEAGDIYRACQTKNAPIKNWVELAVQRARLTKVPVIFWLDAARAHDANLIAIVNAHLATLDVDGLDIQIMSPQEATMYTNERLIKGLDTNAATGNVLRDHLTDMYPILELGTSAKMLSIVPLMNGGGLFETGAGGSAPKHVQQFVEENHLRWDSLGEFCALAASLEHLGHAHDNQEAMILAKTLDQATTRLLNEGKSPQRKVGQIDNRGSHFYLSLFWAEALAADISDFGKGFKSLSTYLRDNEAAILDDIKQAGGGPNDIHGYYYPDNAKVLHAMRPSKRFNEFIDS